MRKLTVINSLTGGVQVVIGALISLATVPLFIHKMGSELYGVFSLIVVVNSLSVFTSFGFNYSLIKYLSEQGKTVESDYDILTAFIVLSVVLLPIAALGILWNDAILSSVLHISANHLGADTRWLFNFYVLAIVFLVLAQIPSAVLDSQQKVYVTNTSQVFYNLISRAAILVSISLSTSLVWIGVVYFLSTLIWFLVLAVLAYRSWGFFTADHYLRNFTRVAKKHFSYGSRIYLTGAISFFYEPITKILISRYIGLSEVGFFDIGLKVRSLVWSVPERLLYPMLPLIANADTKAKARAMVHDVSQKLFFFVVPAGVTFAFVARPIIALWIGNNVDIISFTTILIVLGYLIVLPALPVYQFLTVKDHPGMTTLIQASNASITIVLFYCLVPPLGYIGAVYAYSIAVASSFGFCLYFQHRFLDSLMFDSVSQILKVAVIAAAIFLIDEVLCSRIDGMLLQALSVISINLVVSALLARFVRLVSSSDIKRYTGQFRSLERALCKILVRPVLN